MSTEPQRDPDLQREVDRAVTWWSRYLEGRLLPGLDAEHVARHGVEAMLEHHWRVIPPPPDWRTRRDQPPADPSSNPEWREARQRMRGNQ